MRPVLLPNMLVKISSHHYSVVSTTNQENSFLPPFILLQKTAQNLVLQEREKGTTKGHSKSPGPIST